MMKRSKFEVVSSSWNVLFSQLKRLLLSFFLSPESFFLQNWQRIRWEGRRRRKMTRRLNENGDDSEKTNGRAAMTSSVRDRSQSRDRNEFKLPQLTTKPSRAEETTDSNTRTVSRECTDLSTFRSYRLLVSSPHSKEETSLRVCPVHSCLEKNWTFTVYKIQQSFGGIPFRSHSSLFFVLRHFDSFSLLVFSLFTDTVLPPLKHFLSVVWGFLCEVLVWEFFCGGFSFGGFLCDDVTPSSFSTSFVYSVSLSAHISFLLPPFNDILVGRGSYRDTSRHRDNV